MKNTIHHIWQIPSNLKMDVIKRQLCREEDWILDNIRFLLDGERIKDDETPASLGLSNGDIIEVFFEMTGGGPPENLKKNLSGDEQKILDILENTFDSDNPDDSLDEEEKVEDDELISSFKDECLPAVQYNNELKKKILETSPREVEEILDLKRATQLPNEEDTIPNKELVKDNQNIVQDLRDKYENGSLLDNKELDKKIIHLLKQPNLAPVEINMLTILKERKELMEKMNEEDKTLVPNKKKMSRKRKLISNEYHPPIKTPGSFRSEISMQHI